MLLTPLCVLLCVSFVCRAADNDLTLDLIYGECRGRSRQGNPPNLEELAGRFPRLRPRLDRQLEIASWFEEAGGSDAQPEEDSRG